MAFDFPAAPAVDQVYTHVPTGLIYTWNGSVWIPGPSSTAPNPYVLRAGDTMTGILALVDPDPTAPLHSTHKKYVDRIVSEQALYQSTWQVAANVPDLNVPPNAPLNGYTWTAQTVDPAIPEVAAATIPGIGGNTIAALDTIRWNATLLEYEQIRGPTALSQMTIADGPPVGGFHGQQWWDSDAGKNYVFYIDANGDGYWVQTSGGGGTLQGQIPDDAPTDTLLYGRKSATVGATPAWAEVSPSTFGPVAVTVADTFPAAPIQGQLHFLSTDASLYVWFIDASTVGSWVEVSAL